MTVNDLGDGADTPPHQMLGWRGRGPHCHISVTLGAIEEMNKDRYLEHGLGERALEASKDR